MRELTHQELATFDGRGGRPVYIAFEGRVYDVSDSPLWATGLHMNRHPSGKDVTADISAAPHGTEVLERYPQIGSVARGASEELQHLPAVLQKIIGAFPAARRHPHPVFVHYPVAFLMATSFFVLLHLLFQKPSFGLTAYYLLILGAVSTPFAVATGLLTWWVNYRLKLTFFVKRKIQLSIVLLAFEIILLVWRNSSPGVSHPVYYIMAFLLTPIVFLLGYYGGQMTFPIEKGKV